MKSSQTLRTKYTNMTTSQSLQTGGFVDGPFVGLEYGTPSQSGIVGQHGNFSYQKGEVVEFSVGSLKIGSALGGANLTLAALDGAQDVDLFRPSTVNRARFILSLAQEPDLRSGVIINQNIAETISMHADGILFNSDVSTFENATPVHAVFKELNLRFRGVAEVRNHLRRSIQGIKVLRDVKIPTRDGSWFCADVFRPIGKGPWPVLMNLSVYGRAFRIGAILNDNDVQISEEREDAWQENKREDIPAFFKMSETAFRPNATAWVPRGYVMIRVDHRGIGNTPGEVNPFSQQEALDYYDAIEWSAKQSWSDGKVGLFGASYHATNQWNVAELHPPSLKAIAPLSSDGDAYRDLSYPGGIYIGNYRAYWWNVLVGKARDPESTAVDFVGGFKEHPFDDDFYHGKRLLSADFSKINIPVLTSVSQTELIHSRAGFEAFREVSSNVKHLLIWDAFYMNSLVDDSDADLRTFFDEHLKGINPIKKLPPVRMMMRTGDTKYEWRDATSWPLPETDYQRFFLTAKGTSEQGLLETSEPTSEAVAEYSADKRFPPGSKESMASFETAPFAHDLVFAGHIKATIWVSSSTSDADLWISLRIMDGDREVPYRTFAPDSFQNDPQAKNARGVPPMTSGSLRVSQRVIDPLRSTADRPWHTHRKEDVQLLIPNEPVEAEVELFASAGRIPAGHRIRVEVSANPGTGSLPGFDAAYDEAYHKGAVNRVHTGGVHLSSLTLPVAPPN